MTKNFSEIVSNKKIPIKIKVKVPKDEDIKEVTKCTISQFQNDKSLKLEIKLLSIIKLDNKNIEEFRRIASDLQILSSIVGKLPPI